MNTETENKSSSNRREGGSNASMFSLAMNRPYALKRIFQAPLLGVLAACGAVALIVLWAAIGIAGAVAYDVSNYIYKKVRKQ